MKKGSGKLLVIFLFFLLLFGFGLKILRNNSFLIPKKPQSQGGEKFMPLTGKKILMIIAPQKFRDEEFLIPQKVLRREGAEITVASKNVKKSKGMLGEEVVVDKDIKEINVLDYDAFIFVGGIGASVYFSDEEVLDLVKNAYQNNKIIAAICIAPSILANAGIIKGKKATAFFSEEDNLREKGADFIKEKVVIDGKIITASGPEAAADFAQAIKNQLLKI